MHLHPLCLESVLHLSDLLKCGRIVGLTFPLRIRLVTDRRQILPNLRLNQMLRSDSL